MDKIDEYILDLSEEIEVLRSRYIDKYIPAKPNDVPDVFEYDVKSFCILSHACFEEFIEQISEYVLDEIPSDFLNRKISLSTVLLLISYSDKLKLDVDEAEDIGSCFNIIRKKIDECRNKHTKSIMDNHGFSKKYLRNILMPVGLNVNFDISEESAIKKLSEARGSFAHSKSKKAAYGKYKMAKTLLTPEDANEMIVDCLSACGKIASNVRDRW